MEICNERLLGITYKELATNEEVSVKITQAVGEHIDLLTIVKRRKLKLYGHVTRSSGLAKAVLQGTVEGELKQGRPRKRLACNIKEWTGLSFADSQKAVEDREKWGKSGCHAIDECSNDHSVKG